MVKKSGKFPRRYVIYLIAVVYLFCDLYWLKGPLYHRVEYQRGAKGRARLEIEEGRWVARVNMHPLTRQQLDLATRVYLYRRGDEVEDVSESALRVTRRAVMQSLVNDELIRQYARAEKFVADSDAVGQRITEFKSQFENEEMMNQRLTGQKMTEQDLAELLRLHVTQQLWLEKRISPAVQVDDAEALKWYKDNHKDEEAKGFSVPDIIRARHIFISTIEEDNEAKKTLIDDIYKQLTVDKKVFAEVAKQYSEDERTKSSGGELGWFSQRRMPEDFMKKVVPLKQGVPSEPFHTSLGWHIVELTDRKETRELTYEELKPEIVARLKNKKRKGILQVFMLKLRRASNIEIYPENF